jgi:spore germination protein GerM
MTEDRQTLTALPRNLIVAAIAGLLLIAGGTAWWRITAFQQADTTNQVEPDSTAQTDDVAIAQVYVLTLDENAIALTPIPFESEESDPETALTAAFEQLLAGELTDDNRFSEIPEGTVLQSLAVEADGIYLSLSDDFTQGGGSASMQGRLGQVIYTATSVDEDAAVWISVDGEPLEVLGGEGLLVDQPMTRDRFDEYFSLDSAP